MLYPENQPQQQIIFSTQKIFLKPFFFVLGQV